MEAIENDVKKMAEISMEMFEELTRNLKNIDEQRINALRDRDKDLDDLQIEVQKNIILAVSKWQPQADDLRLLFAYMQIVNSIERIGDHIRGNAKKLLSLRAEDKNFLNINAIGLHALCIPIKEMLAKAYDDLFQEQAHYAQHILNKDEEVDELYHNFLETITQYIKDDLKAIDSFADSLLMAKNFERIADHATNISEMLLYAYNHYQLSSSRGDFMENR